MRIEYLIFLPNLTSFWCRFNKDKEAISIDFRPSLIQYGGFSVSVCMVSED